jgi:hypothetical protein
MVVAFVDDAIQDVRGMCDVMARALGYALWAMQPVSAVPWNTAGPMVSNPRYPDTVPLATAATPPTAVDAEVRHKRVAPGEPHAVGNGQLTHAHHGIRPVWSR